MTVNDETARLLKEVVDHFQSEDRTTRQRQLLTWRRLKLLWENMQQLYYSEVAHDWRIPEWSRNEDTDQAAYDKPINIFRAYLESIIAALSVQIPGIECYPNDADDPLDISTANAGNKIAELLNRHNDAQLLWLHSLFIYCTEGMTASYIYPEDTGEEYSEPKYEEQEELRSFQACPECGAEMFTSVDEFAPEGELEYCLECGNQVIPEIKESSSFTTKLVNIELKPKQSICMEAFGGLNVKVPIWARTQKEIPYLIYSYETHYVNTLSDYPSLRDKLKIKDKLDTAGPYDAYEQWARLSPQYRGEYPVNNVTCRKVWLRPCAFEILCEDDAKTLKKKYKNGVKVVLVNDHVCDAEEQKLDDYWTITYNPLSDYIHFDPLGLLLTSIQEITNDLVSLVIQTTEHGIGQTFADPKTLDFEAYRQQEALPGGVYPAVPKSGKPLSESFYEIKTAQLSSEVLPFAEKVQQMGQLVSGALPSLFGGNMSGSRTASEYSMSRAQALQRLQNTWKTLTTWWKEIFSKAIPMFIQVMKEDEKSVKKDEFGNFINVFIRKAELEGKIGQVELEGSENLPITWSQQKDTIMQLIETNNEMVLSTLASPENLPYLRRAIGLTGYEVPGEDDRQKQYEEIVQLVNSEPIVLPPDPQMIMQSLMMGAPPPQEEEFPSIEVDQDVDNHQIESDICRRWLVSEAGRLARIDNPKGYKNVLLHYKMHKMMLQMQQPMMGAPVTSGANPEQSTEPFGATPPIQGEQNVNSVQ
jgi:hypothetical protein